MNIINNLCSIIYFVSLISVQSDMPLYDFDQLAIDSGALLFSTEQEKWRKKNGVTINGD